MGIFDFLSGDVAAPSTTDQVPVTTGTSPSGNLLTDPNFLRLLAGMGSGFSKGLGVGEAIGGPTVEMIRNQQAQKAGGNILKQLLDGGTTPTPTPRGVAGPDVVTTKRTADGTTTTVQEPSAANLSTFGTNVPAESIPAPTVGGTNQSPFWKALLQ